MRPLLVLLPSLGTTVDALWGPCAALLAEDHEVVGRELPGHAADRSVPEPQPTMADLAAAVLDRVGARTFHVAGDSVGGAIGLQLLLDAPDQVASATLLCTGARIGTPESWTERAEQVRLSGTPSLVGPAAVRWFGPGFLERDPGRASALLHALRDISDDGYRAGCHALARFDVRDRLGAITAPVLVVTGSHDLATPPELGREVAAGVQDGRCVELPGVGHQAPAEAPEAVATLIREHVLAATTTTDGGRG